MLPRHDPDPGWAAGAGRAAAATTVRNPAPQVSSPAMGWGAGPQGAITAAGADLASRIAVMRWAGDAAGNSAAAGLAGATRRVAQREGSGEPRDEPAYALSSPRFAGQARLREIANGGPPLRRGDPMPAVKAVQTALLDLGYSLLRYKDDGRYGSETDTAIGQFRADRGVGGDGGMDAAAMRRLDQLAPAPGVQEQHYLDYSRLFADGRLDVTLAIGYDEGQTHFADLDSARSWMTAHHLKPAASSGAAATQAAAGAVPIPGTGTPEGEAAGGQGATPAPDPDAATRRGISVPETWTGVRTVTYPDHDGKRITRDITVTITLIPPGTGAKAAYAKGLNQSEVAIYSGHARRGIGPDFDADKSPYENFIIGIGSALHEAGRVQAAGAVAESHYVTSRKNDLETMRSSGAWDEEKYRVWFFSACSSIAYMDELRGGLLPDRMDRHSLDLFGTTQEIPIAGGLEPVFANLEGILNAETMEQITLEMQRSTLEALRKYAESKGVTGAAADRALQPFAGQMFMREGAGDNQVVVR
jgi:peptidoglycan hydrolase-like protein with peptidoglycan-binding domain